MKEIKFKIVVQEDGKIVVTDVPVKSGQEIELTLRIPQTVEPTSPLRGLPVRYIDPFLPVDEDDWDSAR